MRDCEKSKDVSKKPRQRNVRNVRNVISKDTHLFTCYDMKPPTVFEFPNGMTFAYYRVPYQHLFRVELFLRAGAIHQKNGEYFKKKFPKITELHEFGNLGYAHFLEHLISFYPSKKYKDSLENQRELSARGINMNAWTDDDNCGYWMAGVGQDNLDFVLDLMVNNLMEPEWGNKDVFDSEKSAVERELSGHLNDPMYNLTTMMSRILLRDTMLEYSTKAELDSVYKIEPENFATFFREFYHPENMILSIIGNDDPKRVFNNLIKTYPGYFNKKKNNKRVSLELPRPILETPNGANYFVVSNNEEYKIVYHIPLEGVTFFDDRRYILEYIPVILTGTLSSRLYKELRSDLGAVYNVHAELNLDPRDSTYSYFSIETMTNKDKVLDVFNTIEKHLRNFGSVSDEEITTCRLKTDGQYYGMVQSKRFSDAFDFYNKFVVWAKPEGEPTQRTRDVTVTLKDIKKQSIKTEYEKTIRVTNREIQNAAIELFSKPIFRFYSGKEHVLTKKNINKYIKILKDEKQENRNKKEHEKGYKEENYNCYISDNEIHWSIYDMNSHPEDVVRERSLWEKWFGEHYTDKE